MKKVPRERSCQRSSVLAIRDPSPASAFSAKPAVVSQVHENRRSEELPARRFGRKRNEEKRRWAYFPETLAKYLDLSIRQKIYRD